MNVIDAVAPRRLGKPFRVLLAASWISYLGDGLVLAAGPLLVASLTRSAFLIAAAAFLEWLPPLLFGLWAGALSDRVDRRLIIVTANVLRALLLVLLAVAIVTGAVSVGLVLGTLFLLATAEAFADNTSSTLLPMIVHRDDLPIANSRQMAGFWLGAELAGPPIGAALFALGRASSFATQAVLVACAALLIARMRLPPRLEPGGRSAEHRIRHDIAEGVQWVRRHAAVRTLVLTIFTFNITFGAAWSVLVLYAKQQLGLSSFGFGLVATVSAVGGLIGTVGYGRITKVMSLGTIMRVGLVIETLTHLGLALATTPWVAMPIFFVFGAHAAVWGTTSVAVRQRATPTHLQGRVASINTLGTYAGLVIGSGVGGMLAEHAGVAAPFWFAFGGSGVFLVLIWHQLTHIAHEDATYPGETLDETC